jgi:hypothetical protein
VTGLPLSHSKRNARSWRSAKNGSRATGDAGRSTPIETDAGVAELAAASGAAASELPAAPVRADNSAQIAIRSGNI